MEPISIEDARDLIAQIRVEKGEISNEVRAMCHPELLEALANIRCDLGKTTKTFVDQLYSKDTRFLYELIQNAEDNTYTRAEGKIYLSFSLYPDRLVLDSNEDGFREEHVRAICDTAASTKAVFRGFIGEKGIGFKSVFKVAKKVHVQSHPFSFSFSHRKDSSDDVLGMITPYEEDYDPLPEGVNTRITLTLLDPSSFQQRADELLDLPDTLLLFLPKLQLLHIKIYPRDKKATEIIFTHTSHENKLETITKTTTSDGESTDQNIDFYVLRRDIRDLSPDEARENNNEATVVLAFPVDVAQTPIIEKQLAFAFLPLRKLGFTFLIQSDFITQASREDVVHRERNKDLLLGVAETFRDAVLHFCQHPILRYQWMRYLPDDSITDEFWRGLNPQIVSLLKETPILLPWSETKFCLPSEVYYLPDWLRDEHGQPLFADSEEEEYLSPQYTWDDLNRLDTLGLKDVHWSDILRRFRADLKTKNPRMSVNDPIDENWQTRAQSPCYGDTQAFRIFKENFQIFVDPRSTNASAKTETALLPRDRPLLEFLLQSQFDEVAQGEFAWLHEVNRLGYTRVEIAELLFVELTESPWIFFEPGSAFSPEMKLDFHLPNCAHAILQAGMESTTFSTLASSQFKTMDVATASAAQDKDSIHHQISEWCGLAGIVPSTDNLSTWIGRVEFEHENTTSRIIYGSSDEIITDRDLIECCVRALQGLSSAIGYYQQVSSCCDSFTILKYLEHENAKMIQMVQIRFELIAQLHGALLEILRGPIDTSNTRNFHACTLVVGEILLIFGIPYCTDTEDLSAENYQVEDRCSTIHRYCLAVQSLCLGFLTYSQAHCGKLQPFFLDTAQQKVTLQGSKLDPGLSWQLHVQLLDLTCIGDMLDDSVLVFSASKEDRNCLFPLTEHAYDLLASPQDLLDTWGPGQFVSLESEPTSGVFCAISIRGGTIIAEDSEGSRFHWSRATVYDGGPQSRFNAKDMLLIGGSVTIKLDCPSDKHQLWENAGEEMSTLGTSEGYWKNAERQAGFQAGEYVSFAFQNVWAKVAGKSLKDCHLEQEPLSYSFLQSRWGLQISCCTGVARRVPLCELLADVMPHFVESLFPIPPLWEKLKRDHGIIQAFSGSSLQQWLKNLNEDCQLLALRITRYILSILRHTGIDRKGQYLTVSWPQKENPFQSLKLNCDKQNFWTRLLADSVDCATFAYITPNCLETTNLKCRGLVPNWYGYSALLDTAVCRHFTSRDPTQNMSVEWTLKDKETYCMGKPDSMLLISVERADPNTIPRLYVSESSIPKSIIRRIFHLARVRKVLNLQKLREKQWIGGRSESVLILVRG